jgi:hypothetical protein
METTSNEPAPQEIKAITITEAAQRLGVSERTIYRRLQAGKLQRVNMSDRNMGSVRQTLLLHPHTETENELCVSEVSDNMSDNSVTVAIETLRGELENKDAQIAKLIDSQQEMTQTLRQLQEQMFELARLVLSHQAASVSRSSAPEAASSRYANRNTSGFLARLFGFRDKRTGEPSP